MVQTHELPDSVKSIVNLSTLRPQNMDSKQKTSTSKKVWAAPSLELIEVKSKVDAKLLPGVNLLGPHAS